MKTYEEFYAENVAELERDDPNSRFDRHIIATAWTKADMANQSSSPVLNACNTCSLKLKGKENYTCLAEPILPANIYFTPKVDPFIIRKNVESWPNLKLKPCPLWRQ